MQLGRLHGACAAPFTLGGGSARASSVVASPKKALTATAATAELLLFFSVHCGKSVVVLKYEQRYFYGRPGEETSGSR